MMKNLYLYIFWGLFCLVGLAPTTLSAQSLPYTNPYEARYGQQNHWTGAVNWARIWVATANGVDTGLGVDSNSVYLNQLMDSISHKGGGVVYFPPGDYYFEDSLLLPTGVFLRGARSNEANALDSAFDPPSNLNFPAYLPDTNQDGQLDSVPIQHSFKAIANQPQAHTFGLIDLDINRASIYVFPRSAYRNPVGSQTQAQPVDSLLSYNVLVMGCRQNNASVPDPSIPHGAMHAWQRWSWRFAANMGIVAAKNVALCNNRLNDFERNSNQPIPDESYAQFGYIGKNGGCSDAVDSTGWMRPYSMTDHYGIALNTLKYNRINPSYATGYQHPLGIIPTKSSADPDEEFIYFKPGMEVRDNWVFCTQRKRINAAGQGLVIKGNEVFDVPGKDKPRASLTGSHCNVAVLASTFDDRGIEWAGWDVLIDSNRVHITPTNVKGYGPNNSGEGIINHFQNGSTTNGATITHNTLIGPRANISILKGYDVSDLHVAANDLTQGRGISIQSGGGGSGQLSRVQILGNQLDTANIKVTTSASPVTGCDVEIAQNVSAQGSIDYPSFAFGCGNTGFNPVDLPQGCAAVPCNEEFEMSWLIPQQDTLLPATTTSFIFKAKARYSTYDSTRIAYFVDNQLVHRDSLSDGDSLSSFNLSPLQPGRYLVSARMEDKAQRLAYLPPLELVVGQIYPEDTLPDTASGPAQVQDPAISGPDFKIYPQPLMGSLLSVEMEKEELPSHLFWHIYSLQGRLLRRGRLLPTTPKQELALGSLPAGSYLFLVRGQGYRRMQRLVKL